MTFPNASFKARSAGRDSQTDVQRVSMISDSIESALNATQFEYAGLRRRLDEVLARAAVTAGNDSDEYLHREPEDIRFQDLFSTQIASAERRLHELEVSMAHFRFLKAELETRFSQQASETAS